MQLYKKIENVRDINVILRSPKFQECHQLLCALRFYKQRPTCPATATNQIKTDCWKHEFLKENNNNETISHETEMTLIY